MPGCNPYPSIVIPAYGRDYKTAEIAKRDFDGGKDFIISDISCKWDGKPCSIRDLPVGREVKIRFNSLTDFAFFRVVEGGKSIKIQ